MRVTNPDIGALLAVAFALIPISILSLVALTLHLAFGATPTAPLPDKYAPNAELQLALLAVGLTAAALTKLVVWVIER